MGATWNVREGRTKGDGGEFGLSHRLGAVVLHLGFVIPPGVGVGVGVDSTHSGRAHLTCSSLGIRELKV